MDLTSMLTSLRSMTQQPNNPAMFDRDFVVKRHMESMESFARASSSGFATSFTNTSTDAPNQSMPMVEVIRSNMITIDDIIRMGPDHVHARKFLLCRSIAPSWKINAINVALDDPKGDKALPLSLYNYKVTGKRTSDADLVPVGSIIALMNPWLKISAAGFPVLRCENAMHFVFLDQSHPILQGISWKVPLPTPTNSSAASSVLSYDNMEPSKAGLCYFADKKYDKAVECYTKVIDADPNNAAMYANRASAYLGLGKMRLALEDAEKGLEIEPSNVKLLFRKGKALYGLKRYEECLEFMKKDVKRGSITEIATLFNDVQQAYREWKNGKYDLLKMVEEAEKNPFLEHADYFNSSLVEVQAVPGFERGMVAKVDIPAGTLICAQKAFAYRKTDLKSIQMNLNLSKKVVDIGASELIASISEQLLGDPSLGHEFYKLYAGDKLRWLENYDESQPIDIERIQEIIRCNAFAAGNDLGLSEAVSEMIHDSGIWFLPSYVNHSCTEINSTRATIGDFMFVRTIKNVQKGKEILFQYVEPTKPFEERDKLLRETYGFVCNCRLCLLESAESPTTRQELARISDELKELAKKDQESKKPKSKKKSGRSRNAPTDHSESIQKLSKLLDEARALRQDQSLNLLACEISDGLAFLHIQQGQFNEAVALLESCFKIYEDFGMCMKALDSAHGLCICYSSQTNAKLAGAWDQKTRSLARYMFGDEKMLTYLQKIHSA